MKKNIFILMIVILSIFYYLIPQTYSKYYSSFKSTITINNHKPKYIIKFNANSGNGIMEEMNLEYGICYNLNLNTYVKEGYAFKGWTTLEDGTGKYYQDGESVMNLSQNDNEVIQLYAKWEKKY